MTNRSSFLPSSWLTPDLGGIAGVRAVFTSRDGGSSQPPFDRLNLGDHVGDQPQQVAANRQVLAQSLARADGSCARPIFLQQVHGCEVLALAPETAGGQPFDASLTAQPGLACTIMVADCLPVLLAHASGAVVGAAHAGWRGLVGQHGRGVQEALWDRYLLELQQQLGAQAGDAAEIAANTAVWLGPCIGPQAFEVGDEVRQAFVLGNPLADPHFVPHGPGKWLANLAGLARQRWERLGLRQIRGNDGSQSWCTVSQADRFFSHRRDAAVLGSTGRMAACIWID